MLPRYCTVEQSMSRNFWTPSLTKIEVLKLVVPFYCKLGAHVNASHPTHNDIGRKKVNGVYFSASCTVVRFLKLKKFELEARCDSVTSGAKTQKVRPAVMWCFSELESIIGYFDESDQQLEYLSSAPTRRSSTSFKCSALNLCLDNSIGRLWTLQVDNHR